MEVKMELATMIKMGMTSDYKAMLEQLESYEDIVSETQKCLEALNMRLEEARAAGNTRHVFIMEAYAKYLETIIEGYSDMQDTLVSMRSECEKLDQALDESFSM